MTTVGTEAKEIQTQSVANCFLCGAKGNELYRGLKDYSFYVPGVWNVRSCTICRTAWLDPRPNPSEVYKLYTSYHTHQAFPPRKQFFASLREQIRQYVWERDYNYSAPSGARSASLLVKALSLLPVVRNRYSIDIMGLPAARRGKLLDVGCGNGAFLAQMRRLGWQVQGTEIDEQAAAIAKQNFDIDVISGTLFDAALPDESFDVITLSHVIEHVDDPIALFVECRKLLQKGGLLVITTPNIESLGHQMFKQDWRGLEIPRHFSLFSAHALAQCGQQSGLTTVALQSTIRLTHNIYLASELIKMQRLFPGKTNTLTKMHKIKGRMFQLVEAASNIWWKMAGDELYYVGAKIDATRG